ncbi:hypothetical protein [Microseira wollei]|uniref:hypothetical protein n=1 Tax=Microseira wollei TaxID=467598 RepID=UPI001CFC5CE6|nr:hypothetical protein [Microseira wollei]
MPLPPTNATGHDITAVFHGVQHSYCCRGTAAISAQNMKVVCCRAPTTYQCNRT